MFLHEKANIDTILERLQEASDDHFDVHPDGVDYSHAADLVEMSRRLQKIADLVFGEGTGAAWVDAPRPA